MNRRLIQSVFPVLGLFLLLGLFPGPVCADEPSSENAIMETLPLDNLSPRERERVLTAVRKLVRIHKTTGDAGSGETRAYVEIVEELARFLKRETIEERRRLLQEAADLFRMVDRNWIDNIFALHRGHGSVLPRAARPKLNEQEALLRKIGRLLKEEQAIPAEQKALELTSERLYRDLIRLVEEGRRRLESIDNEAVESQLRWMVDDLDRVLEESIIPNHERQVRLIALHRKISRGAGGAARQKSLALFREYASKVRAMIKVADTAAVSD